MPVFLHTTWVASWLLSSVQPCILGARSCMDGLVVPRGRPRYVNGMEAVEQANIDAMFWQSSGDVLICIIVDFWKLMRSPMDSTLFVRRSFIKWAYVVHACITINMSSAYWITGKSVAWSSLNGCRRSCLRIASLIVVCNNSATRTKIKEDSGPP